MMGDPFTHLFFWIVGILIVAFTVGFLLFQFGYHAGWCLVVGEAPILLYYFYFVYRPSTPGGFEMFVTHVLGFPLLLIPLLAGYFFNKHVIIHSE